MAQLNDLLIVEINNIKYLNVPQYSRKKHLTTS